jgi:hypothetical protein
VATAQSMQLHNISEQWFCDIAQILGARISDAGSVIFLSLQDDRSHRTFVGSAVHFRERQPFTLQRRSLIEVEFRGRISSSNAGLLLLEQTGVEL